MNVQFVFPLRQWPWWAFLAAAVLLGLASLLRSLERQRESRLYAFVAADLAPRLLVGYDARIRRPLFWFALAGTACLAVTFAQPRWGEAWVQAVRGSRDILVLLDTSESMNAANPAPNRLVRARQKIESLLELCPGDRFGLIAFSGEAALECPLTRDHAYFRSVLATVDTNTLNEEGTDIAEALQQAAAVFAEDVRRSSAPGRSHRAIVLCSDGEQVSGDGIKAAAEIGRLSGIYVLGIGDLKGGEVRLPSWMREYLRSSEAGQPHVSRLDEKTLSEIAVQGGGMYIRSTPDNADVARIRDELQAVAAHRTPGEMRYSLVNRYRWPLSLAIGFFAAEGAWLALMPRIRRRRLAREAHAVRETG